MSLDGSRIIVTGASRGIGAALARRLAEERADLVLVARNGQHLEALADEVGGAEVFTGDLTDPAFRVELVEGVLSNGEVDVWINNAGLAVYGPFAEQDPGDIAAVLRLNLEAPVDLCRRILPTMLERGSGHIVNVSSVAMAVTTPGFATYGSSKSGLSAFDASLSLELEGTGVGLTTVEIGEVDTAMLRYLRSDPDIDAIFARSEKLGAQRLLQPDEVADAIVAGVVDNKRYVRLPRRAGAFPAWVNGPRALSNVVNRWF